MGPGAALLSLLLGELPSDNYGNPKGQGSGLALSFINLVPDVLEKTNQNIDCCLWKRKAWHKEPQSPLCQPVMRNYFALTFRRFLLEMVIPVTPAPETNNSAAQRVILRSSPVSGDGGLPVDVSLAGQRGHAHDAGGRCVGGSRSFWSGPGARKSDFTIYGIPSPPCLWKTAWM